VISLGHGTRAPSTAGERDGGDARKGTCTELTLSFNAYLARRCDLLGFVFVDRGLAARSRDGLI
jgi:hypothetical protein